MGLLTAIWTVNHKELLSSKIKRWNYVISHIDLFCKLFRTYLCFFRLQPECWIPLTEHFLLLFRNAEIFAQCTTCTFHNLHNNDRHFLTSKRTYESGCTVGNTLNYSELPQIPRVTSHSSVPSLKQPPAACLFLSPQNTSRTY